MHSSTPSRQVSRSHDARSAQRTLAFAGGALLSACAAACGGGSPGTGSTNPPGSTPTSNGLGSYFLPTPHHAGGAADLAIVGLAWGRLIDVFDSTGDPQQPISLVFEDLLVDHTLIASTPEFEVRANPVSGKEYVVVAHPRESSEFLGVLAELLDTQPLPAKGLGANVLPPFTAVSRNAAVVIDFDDLIDPATVTAQNILLMTGDPPSLPFEARIVPSRTHGALLDGTFRTTRVIVDFTITALDALAHPELEINALGLPAALQVNAPNAVLRIPTRTGPGQFSVLTNLSGGALDFASAGPGDPGSPTLDVLRAFRSQGKSEITGDADNGFLPDGIAPSVLGTQAVFAAQSAPGDPSQIDVTFLTAACAMPLRAGDVLEFSGFVLQVVAPGQLAGNVVVDARVVALVGDLAAFGPSFGQFKTHWDPALGAPPECFVRFDPPPGSAPATDVLTTTTLIAEFSEPMDPAQVLALETFRVRYDVPPVADNPMYANVVGRILPAADLKRFVFAPSLPLRHTQGASESYAVELAADDPATPLIEGLTDLAGNALEFELPAASFTIAAAEATHATGGYALRFADPLGDEDGNGKPDLRGQYVIDPRQVVKPRPVQRFSVLIDDNQPLIGAMPPTPGALQTPLSDKGSKAQLTWRYIDMGFGLLDDQFHNLDVEGVHWASFFPAVSSDTFDAFSLSMTHASVFPDETLTGALLPAFPESGLTPNFVDNLLDPANIPQTLMAHKPNGYAISSSIAFPAPQNPQVLLVPWPVNHDIPQSQYSYWTWRDTGVVQVGGHASGAGVDPQRLGQVTGVPGLVGFYGPAQVPTIGLPMLTEYRTFPDAGAFALNGFKTSFAALSSSMPAMRAWSTGGVPNGQPPVVIDPDNEPLAQGGYTPLGAKLPGIDNTLYWGQADFVVRVSRFHTVWYDSTAAGSLYAPVVLEPSANELPVGTTASVAFRGASALTVAGGASSPPEWADATRIDPYGDAYDQDQLDQLSGVPGSLAPFSVAFFPKADDASWKDSASELDGARYLQMRVTLIAHAESDLTPEVSAIGVAYSAP